MRFTILLLTASVLFSCACANPVPKKEEDLDESWTGLKAGITQIYRREPSLTIPQYMDLIRLVHNYCTKTNLNRIKANRGGAELIGQELYERLKNFLEGYLFELFNGKANMDNEELLTYYSKTWDEYRFSSRVVNDVFKYLNRHWVRREIAEGHKDVYEVFQLTLVKWREHVIKHDWNKKLATAALEQIEYDRNGEVISTHTISSFISCFAELDVEESQHLSFYKEHFEQPFIQETERYYKADSDKCISENSITAYMEHVENRLEEEAKRVERYLHPSTNAILQKTCERVMIEKHMDTMRAEFQNLLNAFRSDDLRRMHNLLSRMGNPLTDLHKILESHVLKEGQDRIVYCGADAINNPDVYVQAIVDVHKKYSQLMKKSFSNDPGFVKAMDEAFIKFVNTNEITKLTKSQNKSPELFAKYTHLLLRKSTQKLEDSEFNEKLNQIITAFNYIDDKDVFQTFYRRLLAKRLITQTSVSDDAESSMISKLKEACGAEYTTKLQRMIQDTTVSKELSEKYRDHKAENNKKGIDYNVQILMAGSWPQMSGQGINLIMPRELEENAQDFNDFYSNVHKNRKLTWQHNMAKGEVVTSYLKNRYVLTVSVYQLAVLQQFNEHDSRSLQELIDFTGIPEEYLVQVLQILLKAKILTCSNGENRLNAESVFKLNMGFKSKKMRINLNVPLKTEEKVEQKVTEKQIDDERVYNIQAAIVRTMKARKELDHQNLVIEVITQLASRFKAQPSVIKKQIDILIEKEYMERKEGQKNVYVYVA